MVSHTMLHVFLIGPLPTAPSQFEVGSTRIEALREVADLESRRESLLSNIGGSSHFRD